MRREHNEAPTAGSIRIIHVISSLGIGGAESVALDLACEHAKVYEVLIVTLFKAAFDEQDIVVSRRAQAMQSHVVVSEGVFRSRISIILSVFRLIYFILTMRPHIVHSHTDLPDFCVSLTRRFLRFRIVRTIHNTKLWHTRKKLAIFTEKGLSQDLVIAINNATMAAYHALRETLKIKSSKHCAIIHTGIRSFSEEEYFSISESRVILGSHPDRVQFGFVGRLELQKGVDILIEAINGLSESTLNRTQFHFIGNGTLSKELLEFQSHIGPAVKIHGGMSSARMLLRGFDCLIIPSRFEGLPLIGVECLMARVPAIISDIPGLVDIFTEQWPLRINAGNILALQKAIDQFCESPFNYNIAEIDLAKFSLNRSSSLYMDEYRRYIVNSDVVSSKE